MAKFHINSNGEAKPCSATRRACQFGDDTLHFGTAEEARAIAEKILEASEGKLHVLKGKKSTLSRLEFRALMATAKGKGDSADGSSIEVKESVNPDKLLDAKLQEAKVKGVREVYYEDVPKSIHRLFSRALSRDGWNIPDEQKAYGENRDGNFSMYGVLENGKVIAYTAPPTKDVPLETARWRAGMPTLHPGGPKIEYACVGCNARDTSRLSDFPHKAQGDFRIRCRACGQLNSFNIAIS